MYVCIYIYIYIESMRTGLRALGTRSAATSPSARRQEAKIDTPTHTKTYKEVPRRTHTDTKRDTPRRKETQTTTKYYYYELSYYVILAYDILFHIIL